ncbi:MAG TPA: glucose 1-dehydrogenase [Puia sp.]|jgi:gluconate 5-dehydrogenase
MATSILELFQLKGQTALIVGGNQGLGLAMASALAEAGAAISIAARNEQRNKEAETFLQKTWSAKTMSHSCDVCSEASVKAAVVATLSRFDRIDILINSAGINIRGPIEQLSLDDFNKVQQVNVTGTWLAAREVVPVMKRQGYGRIINIGSMLSVVAIPDRTPYATSKGAIIQMTRALAIELAREKITVNAILPGPFGTDMNLPLMQDPEKYQAFISKVPMGRWGDLHEIGGVALYLASPASSYTTGACFSVDGGWTTQ